MSTDNLFVEEVYVDATRNAQFGDSGVYETFTNDRGELYRACQEQFGRCVSKVYIDTGEGTKAIGWVFQGKQRYEDTGEPYLREVWVTLHKQPPTKTVKHHYAMEEA